MRPSIEGAPTWRVASCAPSAGTASASAASGGAPAGRSAAIFAGRRPSRAGRAGGAPPSGSSPVHRSSATASKGTSSSASATASLPRYTGPRGPIAVSADSSTGSPHRSASAATGPCPARASCRALSRSMSARR
ncbi:hypothetical protein [Sorangium cellulosum]|uniref:hypothetical protein n=1 Tax=Sorangium cellulosum TaxID=56 RepID=UPI0030B82B33